MELQSDTSEGTPAGGCVCVEGGGRVLTCGHRTNQHRAELDDRAERVLGVSGAGLVLAVELEDEALVLLLQQHQDVFQEEGVELWK